MDLNRHAANQPTGHAHRILRIKQRASEQYQATLVFATSVLGVFLTVGGVQYLIGIIFGTVTHDAVFRMHWEHPWYVWAPFTSSLAHGGVNHLTDNAAPLLLASAGVLVFVSPKRLLTWTYTAAVTGQIVGVLAGKNHVIGASAGVFFVHGMFLVMAPALIGRAWRLSYTTAQDDTWTTWGLRFCSMGVLLYLAAIFFLVGNSLYGNLVAAAAYVQYPWGTAPPGDGMIAHLFGAVTGAVAAAIVLSTPRPSQ